MGLLDILNGIQNGPQGQHQAGGRQAGAGSGGMSPLMMALLGLLAYKAVKGGGLGNILGGGQAPAGAGKATSPPPPSVDTRAGAPGGGLADVLGDLLGGKAGGPTRQAAPGASAGGLDDLLRSGLGGLLGAGAGSVLTGGLDSILKDLQNSGQGRVAQSWMGSGPNEDIAPDDLGEALGADTLNALTRQTGLSRAALLDELSQNLPAFIDQLTPNGRMPTTEEASRMI